MLQPSHRAPEIALGVDAGRSADDVQALVLRSADVGLVIVGRSRAGEPGGVARDVLCEAPGPVVVVPVRALCPPAHTLHRTSSSHPPLHHQAVTGAQSAQSLR